MNIGYQWVIVATLWLSHIAYYVNYVAVGALAPFIQPDLRLSAAQLGLLSSAATTGSMLSQIPSGAIADHIGAKWAMAPGLFLIAAASLAISYCHSYAAILLLLVALGIGIGGNQTPASKAIVMWFSFRGRATGMGIKQTGVTVGGILASFLLPAIALRFQTWRPSFLSAGLIAAAAAILVLGLYRDRPVETPTGARPERMSWRSFKGLLTERDFLLLCLAGVFLMASQFIFSTYFILYTATTLKLPLQRCGLLFALAFASGAAGRVAWSMASDYLLKGRRDVILIAIGALGAIPALVLALFTGDMPSFLVTVLAVAFGFCAVGWNAVYLTAVGEYAGKAMAGTANGIAFVISNAGAVAGPPAFGFFADLTGTHRAGWLLCACCMAAVALLTWMKRKERMVEE